MSTNLPAKALFTKQTVAHYSPIKEERNPDTGSDSLTASKQKSNKSKLSSSATRSNVVKEEDEDDSEDEDDIDPVAAQKAKEDVEK